MSRLKQSEHAPDFQMQDLHGNAVVLSEILKTRRVYLVLNRGFA